MQKIPCSQAKPGETGSHMTAHTTIQSSRTAETVLDRKEAVSARISPVSSPDFPSLCTLAVSRADFWPPVSASKNSVRGRWIARGEKAVRGVGEGGFWEAKLPFEPWP